jgi:hypothetical protein
MKAILTVAGVAILASTAMANARIATEIEQPELANILAEGPEEETISIPGAMDDTGKVVTPGEYGFGLDDDDGDGVVDVDPLE